MAFNTSIRTSVGVDLSRTPPIYRPFQDPSRYPDVFVKVHYRPQGGCSELQMKSIIAPYLQKGDIYLWQASIIRKT